MIRRLAQFQLLILFALPQVLFAQNGEWKTLFDGSSLNGWMMSGPGAFTLEADGSMLSHGGMGLFYFAEEKYKDFVLKLDWKASSDSSNSGVFVRFPEAPDPWYAVNTGYEIQIDNSQPPTHQTGSVYSFSAPFKLATKKAGAWNTYKIKVTGQRYRIYLNGELVNDYVGDRSLEGHVGLQNHDDHSKVWFKNISVMPLAPGSEGSATSLAELFKVEEERDPINVLMVTTTHGFRHGPAIDAAKEIMGALNETTEFQFDMTEDLEQLNPENLEKYDLLFFANTTLRGGEDNQPVAEAKSSDDAETFTGTFRNYKFLLSTPQGDFDGKLELSGTPDDLSGTITFAFSTAPEELTNINFDGEQLTFDFNQEFMGDVKGDFKLTETDFDGSLAIMGSDVPLQGTAPGAATETPTEDDDDVWRTYNVRLSTPQGDMTGVLTLTGTPDALGGNLLFDNTPGPAPLLDVVLDGEDLSYHFNGGQYGDIQAKANLANDRYNGTVNVQGMEVPVTGNLGKSSDDEDRPEVAEAQRNAIMDFLRAGKGIVGAHAALDAFYNWNDYREMVGGGLFVEHPWTQSVKINIEEQGNPAVAHMGDSFWIRDEIYVLDESPRWNARVLASLDMNSVGVTEGPADVTRNDYPISWMRNHNGGRVFYTKLGHFPDVWSTPAYLQHLLQGMRMAAGRIEADFSGRRVKETVAENVWPDDIAVDDKGNVWIAELRGKVHLYDAAKDSTWQIALIPTTDPTKIEHGLYGIEVDPNFYNGEPYVYAYYAEQETFINTLSRFEFKEGMLDLTSEKVLLRVPTEPMCCHQAGDLEWGPDGTLFLSTGDTGMSETKPEWEVSKERIEAYKTKHGLKDIHWSGLVDSERSAQNLQDLRGKIVRVNKDGTIPMDNPFYGQPGVRWEIYAYGLRNPYRFKVDHETNELFIGVVGPDAQFDYDEYNISAKGGENFGWPRNLGRLFYNAWTPEDIPNFVPPLWEYTYAGGGRSATVGPIYKYTGPGGFPAAFKNKIFLYDWARRWVKYADVADSRFTSDVEADVRKTAPNIDMPAKRFVNIKTFDTLTNTAPISMELAPDGSLYLAEFDGFWDAGPNAKVTRYRWIEGNEAPIGEATFTPSDRDPLTVQFDGSRSYDPNVDAITYAWDFGDGNQSTDAAPMHTYATVGTYTVTLTVTDPDGLMSKPLTLTVDAGTNVSTRPAEAAKTGTH